MLWRQNTQLGLTQKHFLASLLLPIDLSSTPGTTYQGLHIMATISDPVELVHAAAEENPIDHAARGRPAMVQRNGLAMVRLKKSMNCSIFSLRSAVERKSPRRITLRARMENQISI
jgi:hypothetical protein